MKPLTTLVTTLALATGISSCSSETDAKRAAETAGWQNVRVYDSDFLLNFSCQEGEMAYRIKGKNPRGTEAKATICCGYTTFKDCTIRY